MQYLDIQPVLPLPGAVTGLAVAAAPEGQDAIFFAAGDSRERLAQMPIVTTVRAKGYDVLLCDESVDEFCMMALADYAPKDAVEPDGSTKAWPIKNVGGEDLGLTTEEEKKKAEEATEENADLFDAMTDALAGKVKKVAQSTYLFCPHNMEIQGDLETLQAEVESYI